MGRSVFALVCHLHVNSTFGCQHHYAWSVIRIAVACRILLLHWCPQSPLTCPRIEASHRWDFTAIDIATDCTCMSALWAVKHDREQRSMAFTTVTTTTAISHTTKISAATVVSSVIAAPYGGISVLGHPPKWLIGVVLSWFAFGFVLTVTLIIAQFPKLLTWWPGMSRQRTPPRGQSERRGGRVGEGGSRGLSSAVALPHVKGDVRAGEEASVRNRRGLSIDTQMRARSTGRGLGILVPGEARQQKKVKKRVSFEPSTTCIEGSCETRQAATAPLPHTKTFFGPGHFADGEDKYDYDDETTGRPDIETGHSCADTRDLSDCYDERRASPYSDNHSSAAVEGKGAEARGSARWMEVVNHGFYRVADRLSATFYDQVNGAEEGLLLPVRECEREGCMGMAVD